MGGALTLCCACGGGEGGEGCRVFVSADSVNPRGQLNAPKVLTGNLGRFSVRPGEFTGEFMVFWGVSCYDIF